MIYCKFSTSFLSVDSECSGGGMGRRRGRRERQSGQLQASGECGHPPFSEDTCLFPHLPVPRGRTKQTLSPGFQSVQKSSLLLSPHQFPPPSLLHSLEVSLHNHLHDGASLRPVPSGDCTALDYGLKSPQEWDGGALSLWPILKIFT